MGVRRCFPYSDEFTGGMPIAGDIVGRSEESVIKKAKKKNRGM